MENKFGYKGLLSSLLLGATFCATAAVYTDVNYSVTDQAVAIVAVWVALLATALLNGSGFTPLRSRFSMRNSSTFVLVVACCTIAPLARTSNFTSASDQYYTVGYTMAVFCTAAMFLWHVHICGIIVFFRGLLAAAIIGPVGYLALAYSQGTLSEIATIEKRFATEGMHPNLLGFCCAGFACSAMAGLYLLRGFWRWLSLLALAMSLASVYLASSRGSMVGILTGVCCAALLVLVRLGRAATAGDFRSQRTLLQLGLFCFAAATVMIFAYDDFMRTDVADAVLDRLAIHNEYRGLETGLTGRWDTWRWVYSQYTTTDFWLGVGPRKSSVLAGDIDNGYIVLLLENGLVAGTAVLIRLLYVTGSFIGAALKTRDKQEFVWALFLSLICVTYLTNNFVARYLLGIGNPFCLFGVAIFAVGPKMLPIALAQTKLALGTNLETGQIGPETEVAPRGVQARRSGRPRRQRGRFQ
jgi:O-antigen ligase